MHLGRKLIRLLFDSENVEGYVTLPIARVMRDGTGHYVYDPRFIPPCLQIRSSERLMMIARRLIEILDEKSATLSRAQKDFFTFSSWIFLRRYRCLLVCAHRQRAFPCCGTFVSLNGASGTALC